MFLHLEVTCFLGLSVWGITCPLPTVEFTHSPHFPHSPFWLHKCHFSTHLLDRVKCNGVEPMEHLDHWLSVHNVFLFSLEAIIASISSQDVEMHQGAHQFYLPGGLILWSTLWPTLILTVFLLCWATAVSEALATIPKNHSFLSAECTLTPQLHIFLFASLCVPFDGSPFSSRFPGKAGKLQRNSECPHWLLPSHLILMLGWCTCTPLEFHSYYNRSLKFWLWI